MRPLIEDILKQYFNNRAWFELNDLEKQLCAHLAIAQSLYRLDKYGIAIQQT